MKYKWKENSRKYKLLTIVFLTTTLILTLYVFWPREVMQVIQPILLPELSTSGFSKVDKIETAIIGDSGIVNLRVDCYELSAVVEASQAESIQRGIDKTYTARPNAHDIAKDVFNSLNIQILMVKITELKENSFYSKLILRQGDTILDLDARPSDAVAIALRNNAPIYINSTLLKEVGKKIC